MIQSMHVRWDWQNWIDSGNGTTVKALCGVRTRVHLAGIPGMTVQNISVPVKDVYKFGWCIRCMDHLSYSLHEWWSVEKEYTSDIVLPCYVSTIMVVRGHQSLLRDDHYLRGIPLPNPVAEGWLNSDK